ncbi:MAG: uracil-DNA glycosylase [Oligosphaeraceae bacterium]
MGSIHDELTRILARQQARGVSCAWIAPETLDALARLAATGPRVTTPTPTAAAMPAAQPTRPQPSTAPVAVRPLPPARPAPTAPPPAAPPSAPTPTPLPDLSGLDWEPLLAAARQCQACRLGPTRQNLVFEDGCRRARVMFIGEGPGEEEDRQGVPFVGRAGQLLTRMILAMGLDRASDDPARAAYIANIVKCRPPHNRNPQDDEGTVCLAFLKRQIQLVRPEAIILLGAVPLRFLLGKVGITRMRGQWLDYQGIPVMPTFHPAYLLRFEGYREKFIDEKRKVWADLQQVMARLGLQRPS